MTTDFSQAIVNGFGIAAKWREMNQQEQEMRLNESYRRDAFAEQKRQFNLGLAETTSARNQKDKRVGEQLQLQRDELESQNKYREGSLKNDRWRLGLTERAMNEEKDVRERAEEDAYVGQIARMKFERDRAGDPMSEQELLQAFSGNSTGRRLLDRLGFPTKSTRDGTVFDTPVAGPDGSLTVAGKRKDGSVAIPDQGRTPDNKTPPFTVAPGNATALFIGTVMSTPEGIAAAREHAALTSNQKDVALNEQEIQAEIVKADAAARAQFQAAKEAEAAAQAAQSGLAQPSAQPPSAWSEFVSDTSGAYTEARKDLEYGLAEGRLGLIARSAAGNLGNTISALPRAGWAALKTAANSQTTSDALGLDARQAPAQPPARPPLQEPAPITSLPADHPLMQRRAELLKQQGLDARVDRGLAMGLTPDQAGAYAVSGQPSESIAATQLREYGEQRRQYADAEAEYAKRVDAGFKAVSSTIDDMAKGDEWLGSQRGAMTNIMNMANVTTKGALGADPAMRTTFASNLVSLMRMGDELDGIDPRYKNDIIGAMALKSVNASSASTFDVNNPEQVAQVAGNLNTLYRGVPEGISPKQKALLADLAASDKSPEEMAAIKDAYLNADPATVDKWFSATFH